MQLGSLQYLTDPDIGASHCFTTRLGGVSSGYLSSLNLGAHRGDDPQNVEENYGILAKALSFDPQNLILTRQTHSDIVRTVTRADCRGLDHKDYPACDGLITNDPGAVLAVFTADCTPILLWDPVTGAVGAVHAGWRGTVSAIAEKAVLEMQKQFGCDPANIRAAIGPNIGPCCFETDADVPDALRAALGEAAESMIRPSGQKYYVNLKEANREFLRRAGVTHIRVSSLCTACRQDLFWSHRRVGQQRGSQGAIIVCGRAGE